MLLLYQTQDQSRIVNPAPDWPILGIGEDVGLAYPPRSYFPNTYNTPLQIPPPFVQVSQIVFSFWS